MMIQRFDCQVVVCRKRAEFRIERRRDGVVGRSCATHLALTLRDMQVKEWWTECIVTITPPPKDRS